MTIYDLQLLASSLNDDVLRAITHVGFIKDCSYHLLETLPFSSDNRSEYQFACLAGLIADLERQLIAINKEICDIHGLNIEDL